jgi:hypothetical protein
MRAFIIMALLLLLLTMIGWVTFSRSGTKSSINLETQQIKNDTQNMVDSGKNMLQGTKTAVDNRLERTGEGQRPANEPPAATNGSPAQTAPPHPTTPPMDSGRPYDVTPPNERTATPNSPTTTR